jgi:hypothetical protein
MEVATSKEAAISVSIDMPRSVIAAIPSRVCRQLGFRYPCY